MDKDELEEVEDFEEQSNKETPESSEGDSNQSSPSIEETSSSPQQSSSIITDLLMLWKKIPIFAKGTTLTSIGTILFYVLAALVIILLCAAATGVAEDLFLDMANSNNTIANIGEKVGNFFTGEGFVTNQEEAEKYEKKYYEKLKQVSDYYRNKLGVQIDTTMITATLFYGRGMSDYVDDSSTNIIEELEETLFKDNGLSIDEDIYQGKADFYKLARRHIKTLAKFQIVEHTSFNTCPSNPEISSSKTKTVPTSAEDVADTWTGFNSWNTRSTFDYRPYDYKSFSKIDGSARNIKWCEFKAAEGQLEYAYKEDYEIYKNYFDDYKNCVSECKRLDGTQTWDPHTKQMVTNSCNPEVACSNKEELKDEYLTKLKDSWGDVYEIGNEPNGSEKFVCGNSSTWGNLVDYNNNFRDDPRSTDRNYIFPEDWYDREAEPGFWASTLSWFAGEYEPFGCSAKPSIQIQYNIDISDEGVYYHKLLSPHETFLSNKSFIEKYYPEYISTNPEKSYDDAVEVVDGIFELYDFIADRETTYCYTPSSSSGSYYSEDRNEFISMIANEVVQDMQSSGILASLTIAQATLESRNGNSGLAKAPYNNYYGMTAGSCASKLDTSLRGPIPPQTNGNTCTGNAFWDGTVVRMCNSEGKDCQWYRVYDSFSNSTRDHSRLLGTNMYSCAGITDPLQAVQCVQKTGYASDPNYIDKIMGVINTYNLTQYDIGEWNGEVLDDYGSTQLGTVCYGNPNGTGVIYGEGTVSGTGSQGIRTQLWNTSEYTTYWGSNNNLFYRSSQKLVKECTWYAHGRGLEILTKNGMSLETAQRYMDVMHGNAGLWFGQNKYFSSSSDYTKPKVGAIIVWSNGSKPGHVAVIEDIQYDTSGNITGITTSEGGQSINGFKYTTGRTLDWIKAHRTYKFVGYVYLLD